jgi:carboxypeptidase family protein
MRKNSRYLFFFLMSAMVLCSSFCPKILGQEHTRFKVDGVVVNSVTGKPISRALVQIFSPIQSAILTGSRGEFSFSGVPGGSAHITAFKPGFINKKSSIYTNGRGPIIIGPETGRVVLRLEPEAVISGTVTGKDDEPLEHVNIEVLVSRLVQGHRQLLPANVLNAVRFASSANPQTDEEGSFRLPKLPAGKYYVAVRPQSDSRRALLNSSDKIKNDVGYPALVYYPDVSDFDAAMPVELSAGQHLVLNFSLKLGAVFPVSGIVSSIGAWKQVDRPMLVDHIGQFLLQADEFDQHTGTFKFKAVPSGVYTISLPATDQDNTRVESRSTLTVDGPVTGLKLALSVPREIPIIVREEFTQPAGSRDCEMSMNGKMFRCSEMTPVTVSLSFADSNQNAASNGYGLRDDPSISKLSGVMSGKYDVVVSPRAGYVASARCGSVDLLKEQLVVPEDGEMQPIEVVLRDDYASVKVQVSSDARNQDAWIVMVSQRNDPVVINTPTDSELTYNQLAPGEYTIFALDSAGEIDPFNKETFHRFLEKGTHIALSPGSTEKLSLELIKTGD